ncbi:MAG: TerC family protein, partial [Planctomycetota bacterium]
MEMSWVEAIAGMVSLTAMEVVLGIDNLVILTLLTANLPADQRPLARRIGLIAALVTRLALLGLIGLIMALETPWFEVPAVPGLSGEPHPVTGKMCILFLGGLFLVAKGVREIHHKLEGDHDSEGGKPARTPASFAAVIVWIAVIDILFSIDSVITAVGMVQSVPI